MIFCQSDLGHEKQAFPHANATKKSPNENQKNTPVFGKFANMSSCKKSSLSLNCFRPFSDAPKLPSIESSVRCFSSDGFSKFIEVLLIEEFHHHSVWRNYHFS